MSARSVALVGTKMIVARALPLTILNGIGSRGISASAAGRYGRNCRSGVAGLDEAMRSMMDEISSLYVQNPYWVAVYPRASLSASTYANAGSGLPTSNTFDTALMAAHS